MTQVTKLGSNKCKQDFDNNFVIIVNRSEYKANKKCHIYLSKRNG